MSPGVIPDFLRQREVEFPGLSELIVTDSMHTRKRRLFALADAFVVLPGGLGTFDETIEILTWKQLGQHSQADHPGGYSGLGAAFRRLVDQAIARGFARESVRECSKCRRASRQHSPAWRRLRRLRQAAYFVMPHGRPPAMPSVPGGRSCREPCSPGFAAERAAAGWAVP